MSSKFCSPTPPPKYNNNHAVSVTILPTPHLSLPTLLGYGRATRVLLGG
jgi:hypothetical protein